MPSALQVEYRLLKLALKAYDALRGYPVTLFGLRQGILGTQDAELINAMKRLSAHGFLSLRMWDATLHDDRDYLGEQDDEQFFYGTAGFFLKPTPTSVSYLEQIEPSGKTKKRIGY